MFNWLGNLFPYSDLHSLNLDWILSKMKETAAQAAKAIADSANALAQVIEAKTAAQNAQTAAQNAQTAASNAQTAANNAATSAGNAVNVAQTAQTAAQNAQTAAQNAQTTAENAQTTANGVMDKFPVQSADIANGAVLADNIGAYQITSGKIANGAVSAQKLEVNEMRLKEIPAAYPLNSGALTITYNGTSLIVSSNTFYNTLLNKFDTTLARLGGSAVTYSHSDSNRPYAEFYVKAPILFYTTMKKTDIRVTCGLYASAGENVEFDVIIHNNGDGTGTTTIDAGNSVISGDPFSCQLKAIPFACEIHRAAK